MWILRVRERKLCALVFFVRGCDCILEQSSGTITTAATAAFDSFALGGVYIVGTMILERDQRYQIFFVNCEIRKKVQ